MRGSAPDQSPFGVQQRTRNPASFWIRAASNTEDNDAGDLRHRLSQRGATITAVSERTPRIRRTPLPDDAVIVVRGEDLVDDDAVAQAERFRRRFPDWGRWGLSAMFAESDADVAELGAGPLRRFPILAIYTVDDLETAGFEVVPTFRTPHVTIAFVGEVDDGLERLRSAVHEHRPNPYHGTSSDEEVNP
jgi:hypothetical protein